MIGRALPGRIGIGLGVAVLLLWSLGPIYWSLVTSFMRPADLAAQPPHAFPPTITFQHYTNLLGGASTYQGTATQSVWPQFSRALVNSAVTSVLATVATVVLASLGGYAFVAASLPRPRRHLRAGRGHPRHPGLYGDDPALPPDDRG